MATITFGFKAIKPITAEHPMGSGIEVTYQPGDEVPAGEWKGAAVEALIENGKIMRYATNVYEAGEFGGDAPPVAVLTEAPAEEESGVEEPPEIEATDAPFPQGPTGGFYLLSDGSRVKGKAKALAAQAELDLAAEGE